MNTRQRKVALHNLLTHIRDVETALREDPTNAELYHELRVNQALLSDLGIVHEGREEHLNRTGLDGNGNVVARPGPMPVPEQKEPEDIQPQHIMNDAVMNAGGNRPAFSRALKSKIDAYKKRQEGPQWVARKKWLVNADGEAVEGLGRYRRRRVTRRHTRPRGRRVRGRGGYWDDAWGWLGNKFGDRTGGVAAGNAIWDLGKGAIKRAVGMGAYDMMDQEIPTISNPGGTDGPVTIRHKEFICDIKSSTGFQIQRALPVNPGQAECFPWLNSLANSFTQYRLEGMIFHFKSTSGSLATTQALGEIIMAANYNVNEPVFTSKQQMLNEVMSQSKVPSNDCEVGIECDPRQTVGGGLLYIRNQNYKLTSDLRFSDLCNFYVATQGQSANGINLGELWVTYQISLFKPQFPIPGAENGAKLICPISQVMTFDNLSFQYDNIGMEYNLTAKTITLPLMAAGTTIQIYAAHKFGGAQIVASFGIAVSNSTLANTLEGNTTNSMGSAYGVAILSFQYITTVKITSPVINSVITCSGNFNGNATTTDVYIRVLKNE